MSEQMILIVKIRPPEWNSRLQNTAETLGIDALAQSMQAEGQMNAVNVEGPDDEGFYDLIAGSRRVRAAASLGWKEVRATVSEPTEASHRIILNVVENLQRKDLTLYEQARAISKLRDEKIPVKDVAEKTGLSQQYVSNLDVMFKTLPTLVLKAWEEGQQPATFNFLRDLATDVKKAPSKEVGAEIALEKYQARQELYVDFERDLQQDEADALEESAEDEPKKKKKVSEDFKVSGAIYAALAADIKASKLPGAQLAIAAMAVLKGDSEEIKGVYPSNDTQNAGKNVKPKVKTNKKGKE